MSSSKNVLSKYIISRNTLHWTHFYGGLDKHGQAFSTNQTWLYLNGHAFAYCVQITLHGRYTSHVVDLVG